MRGPHQRIFNQESAGKAPSSSTKTADEEECECQGVYFRAFSWFGALHLALLAGALLLVLTTEPEGNEADSGRPAGPPASWDDDFPIVLDQFDFQDADRDKDGKISEPEMARWAEMAYQHFAEQGAFDATGAPIFVFDTDDDGQVSPEERKDMEGEEGGLPWVRKTLKHTWDHANYWGNGDGLVTWEELLFVDCARIMGQDPAEDAGAGLRRY